MADVVTIELYGSVAVVTIDSPPVNALSTAVREGLAACFDRLRNDESVDAVVLACAGKTFVAGADLGDIDDIVGDMSYHDTFRSIEQLDKPVIAALHGTALGGGVELALACHYRVADPGAKLGFPEINLGLVPGAGGTQRLPRLIGVEAALDMMLGGRPADAATALETGLVDAVADAPLRDFAIAFAERLIESGEGVRRTCGLPLVRDPGTNASLAALRERVAVTMPDREVPAMDIDAVEAALDLPFDEGIKREKAISDASLTTTESIAMRRLFFAERETSRIPGIAPGLARDIASAGIVGGGTMGRGIAMACANSGIPVALLDVDRSAVDASLAAIRAELERRVERGRMTADAAEQRLGLIRGSVDYADFAECDVVIEAVFEDMALKKKVFEQLDTHCKTGAVLASNTSTLDVLEIASATKRPPDVVGLHFFSPAQVMRLLEVVRTDATSDEVIATAMGLARKLKKVGVLSANRHGFIGNRMMDPYGREAERLLLEGATPRQVDDALQRFGMAMGILAVFDMAGVDVGVRVRAANADRLPDDPSFYRASALLVENGMLGQKSGSGYYRYEKGSRERFDHPEALELFANEARRLGIERRSIPDEEIVERCILALINEGATVLEEGVALRAADIDVVYTSGYGFPRHRGGPMFYADTLGLDHVVARIRALARHHDPQYWQPSALLERLAASGERLADFAQEDAT